MIIDFGWFNASFSICIPLLYENICGRDLYYTIVWDKFINWLRGILKKSSECEKEQHHGPKMAPLFTSHNLPPKRPHPIPKNATCKGILPFTNSVHQTTN